MYSRHHSIEALAASATSSQWQDFDEKKASELELSAKTLLKECCTNAREGDHSKSAVRREKKLVVWLLYAIHGRGATPNEIEDFLPGDLHLV